LASHCSGVGILAAVAVAKGVGLWGEARGVAVVEGIGVEVVLYIVNSKIL